MSDLTSADNTPPPSSSASSSSGDQDTKAILPSLNATIENIEESVDQLAKNQNESNSDSGASDQKFLATQLRSLDTHAHATQQAIDFLAKESDPNKGAERPLLKTSLCGMPCSNAKCCDPVHTAGDD